MKKILVFILAIYCVSYVYSDPNDEQIRQAANLLGVPFLDLKQFVMSYQPNPPDEVIEISAGQLSQEFQNNRLKAEDLYNGRTLKITGQIYRIFSMNSIYCLDIRGTSNYYCVRVILTPSELGNIQNFNTGQTITITGLCGGYGDPEVIIRNAVAVK